MRLNIFNSLMGLCVAAAAVSCSDALVDDVNKRPVGGESDMISFVVANENNATRGGSFGNRHCGGAIFHSSNGADSLYLNVEVDDFTCEPTTRSTLTSSDNFFVANNNFAVFGDMTKSDSSVDPIILFNNEKVTCLGNGSEAQWTYNNPRYWFPGHEYSFVAMYPANVTATSSPFSELNYSGNKLSFTYTTPQNYTEIYDFMTATEHRTVSTNEETSVNFDFHHILSRINFKFKVDEDAAHDIVVQGLNISNITTTATYSITPYPSTTDAALTANDFDEEWTKLGLPVENPFHFGNLSTTIKKGESHEFFPDKKEGENDGKVLLVIPQEVPESAELTITYNTVNSTTEDITVNIPLTDLAKFHDNEWGIGKSYTYTLSFKPEIESQIVIELEEDSEIVDAHYVIAKAKVKVPEGYENAWKLVVSASDEADVSIVQKDTSPYETFYQEGYWLDKVAVNGNPTDESARGNNKIKGAGNQDLYIFIPENLDETRYIYIKDEDTNEVIETITQYAPAWDGNIGAERIQDGDEYPWAFSENENSEYIPKIYFNMDKCPDKALYDDITGKYKHDLFKDIVNSSGGGPDKNGVPGKWVVDIDISGYKGFTKLVNNTLNDGKYNTWELINYEGFNDVIALIDLLESAGGKAYKDKNSSNSPIDDPRGLVGGNMKDNAAYACVKKNRHVVEFKGDSYAPMLKEEDLVWFLPSHDEAQFMKDIYPNPYYWTSSAVKDTNSDTYNSDAYKFKLNETPTPENRNTRLPVRACRKKPVSH